jgi:hypothetical protein
VRRCPTSSPPTDHEAAALIARRCDTDPDISDESIRDFLHAWHWEPHVTRAGDQTWRSTELDCYAPRRQALNGALLLYRHEFHVWPDFCAKAWKLPGS